MPETKLIENKTMPLIFFKLYYLQILIPNCKENFQ